MDTDGEETASVVVRDEDEEDEEAQKDSSCPASEDRREQERRSAVCREGQRRSSGRHCSVTFTHPETHTGHNSTQEVMRPSADVTDRK